MSETKKIFSEEYKVTLSETPVSEASEKETETLDQKYGASKPERIIIKGTVSHDENH